MFTSTNANAIYNPRPLTEVIQDKQTQKLNEVFHFAAIRHVSRFST